MITITDTRHTPGQAYPTMGGVGGFGFQPETTEVEWSDGTRLIVEGCHASAIYKGTNYKLPRLSTSLHDDIARRWTRAISVRLQRDVTPNTRLQDRVRDWRTEWPDSDPAV